MYIDTPDTDVADTLADCWVDLAREQRQHDSRLRPAANREEIRGHILQAIVTGGVRVARAAASDTRDGIDVDAESEGDEMTPEIAEGDVLGFVMFSIEQDAFERSLTRGVVQNLYVRPAFRDAGIGSELLRAAEDALKEQGAEAITLEVMARNDAARRFYRRHGYDTHRLRLEKPVESDNHKTE